MVKVDYSGKGTLVIPWTDKEAAAIREVIRNRKNMDEDTYVASRYFSSVMLAKVLKQVLLFADN